MFPESSKELPTLVLSLFIESLKPLLCVLEGFEAKGEVDQEEGKESRHLCTPSVVPLSRRISGAAAAAVGSQFPIRSAATSRSRDRLIGPKGSSDTPEMSDRNQVEFRRDVVESRRRTQRNTLSYGPGNHGTQRVRGVAGAANRDFSLRVSAASQKRYFSKQREGLELMAWHTPQFLLV
uniref:Uncharacterized protein n=1 Tax=Lactuca sativa TaxID=4236 RepID=A0A9R1URF2_LACSA|nr:hypothetical protein LSAT_V11C800420760 [Lactuca sativa]